VEAIARCDAFVLAASERVTRDMYFEVGVAYALKKPIFFFIPYSALRRHMTYMMLALQEAGELEITPYDNEAEVPGHILASLPRAQS
jgi:nucleoside 2-deoxyribosyltransferase